MSQADQLERIDFRSKLIATKKLMGLIRSNQTHDPDQAAKIGEIFKPFERMQQASDEALTWQDQPVKMIGHLKGAKY